MSVRSTRFARSCIPDRIKLRDSRYSKLSRLSVKTEHEFNVRKSLADYVNEELEKLHRVLFYQRVYILAKNVNITEIRSIRSVLSYYQSQDEETKEDFTTIFLEKLNATIRHCNKETFTDDDITGIFLCMGDYTLLIIEGTEDMVVEFCKELATDIVTYWTENKVFWVEDNIEDVYFSKIVNLRSVAVNINEIFPISTSNDEFLMCKQHWQILEKLHFLCGLLGKNLNEIEKVNQQNMLSLEYNKWLVEVQRIELVLNSSRFYRTVQEYSIIYNKIPMQNDVDSLIWPVPYGYTPLGIFQRSPFDVNLTFSNYGKEDIKNDENNMEDKREESQANAENIIKD